MEKILFTSESVTEGHPDKICDAISDAILDALIEKDPMSRVACETSITTGLVLVMGEITTQAYIDIPQIVRETLRNIGYTRGKYGFDADTCGVITCIDEQSKDIAQGVNEALEVKEQNECENAKSMLGAGDQGMMFGYATNETDEFMPYAISLAHKLARQLILMFCLLLSGCSKEEVLEKYNAVVEKVGEVQLTNDINLQGKRDYGEDYYTGTYQAEYKKFSDTEYLFGGTTIERAAGKQVELFCNLEITKGEAEIFIISGSNEPKTLIKTTGTYENTITLPDGSNYIGIVGNDFSGTVKIEVK